METAGGAAAMPSHTLWCERYCAENRPIDTGYRRIDRWVGVSAEHEGELHSLLQLAMARRCKEQVQLELPPKRRMKVSLAVKPAEMKRVVKQMQKIEDLRAAVEAGEADEACGLSVELMRAVSLLAEAKLPAIKDWLEQVLLEGGDPSRKVLLFAHHHLP
jgi:SNF2 family DNA or RNA helicase